MVALAAARSDFGATAPWLARELQWDAYLLRSGATYEECGGRHIITQGGYYQYDRGAGLAYRDRARTTCCR